MLSLQKGSPMGKIIGGEYDGEYLFRKSAFQEEKVKCCNKHSLKCSKKKCCKKCDINDDSDDEDDITDIEFDDGKIVPGPDPDKREVIYIAGKSGTGKTTYAAKWIENYQKQFPLNRIYVFSRKTEDPTLDILKNLIRIPINNRLVDQPIDLTKDLCDCLVLFDDCNTIPEKKLQQAVSKLQNDILEVGRQQKVNIICTSHLINQNNKSDSRTIMNEMTSLTIFPESGIKYFIDYVAKKYLGLAKHDIDAIYDLKSRWVTIFTDSPTTILYEHGAWVTG